MKEIKETERGIRGYQGERGDTRQSKERQTRITGSWFIFTNRITVLGLSMTSRSLSKLKKPPRFDDVVADDLTLWRVSIPDDIDDRRSCLLNGISLTPLPEETSGVLNSYWNATWGGGDDSSH